MPAPITARAMNPTRHSKGSVLVYSASPPHTPPSTLLVVLRRSRRCGTPAAGAGGAGCQDGWSARDGSPEGRSEPGGSGNGAAVMERRLSRAGARNTGQGPRRTPVIGPGRSCLTRGASESPSPPSGRDPGRYSRDLPVDREITSFITRSAAPAPALAPRSWPQRHAPRWQTSGEALQIPDFRFTVRHVVDIKYLMSHNKQNAARFSLDLGDYLIVRPFWHPRTSSAISI